MTLTQAAGLIGFFLGILLHLFLFSALLKRRRKSALETVLLCLIGALLVWFSGSFLSLLLRQMDQQRVSLVLRIVDCATLGGLAFLPPFLLHSHWIYYRKRHSPSNWERKLLKILLAVLYLPAVVLPWVLARVFLSTPGRPLERLIGLEFPFLMLLGLAYYGSAFIGIRILKYPRNKVEWTVFRGLVIIFAIIPVYNFAVFWQSRAALSASQSWLMLGVWLASLLPSSLICYYIYRYQFLDLDTSRPLASALMILVSLSVYISAVWFLGGYLERELKSPPLLLQATLLAGLLLLFPTLSRGLEGLVNRLLSGEIRKYREIGELIHRAAPIMPDPALFRDFVEEHLKHELGTSQVRIRLDEPVGPGRSGENYPLVAGDRNIGYLEIHQPQTDSRAERDSMRFLANEIAVGLERCSSLAAQVRMERELAQKSHMEDLGRMAASVAHNVKNPLSSMKTLLQLFDEAGNLTSDQREEVGMMIREVDRLSSTVTNLLKFSRLEAEQACEPPAVFPLVELTRLVDSLRAVLHGDLQSRGVRLEIESSGRLEVRADPEILTDILANLLVNALEASPRDTVVKVALRQAGGEIIIEVEDQGSGIPSGIRDKIFEPFVTTKSRGTGLGLAIVKKRVAQLAGAISYVSPARVGGTRFTLRFPSMKGSETNHADESAHRR